MIRRQRRQQWEFLALLLTAAGAALTVARAVEPSASVWNGVYSAEQAQRGGAEFAARCANCHGEAVVATGAVPPLTGKKFLYNWDGLPLEALFDRIQLTMPMDHPGSLDRKTAADITAYLLASNHMPAGASELSDDDKGLQAIRFDARKPE